VSLFLHVCVGANASGIDSLLVTKHGVHKNEIYSDELNDEIPLLIRVTDLCDSIGESRPTFILEELRQ
jgi:hypothetical protein